MKELTSSYDDVEKRMAIYLGLGAMLFTALYLLVQGAAPLDFLVRGVLALAVFTVAGWIFGKWLRDAVRANTASELLPENVERQSRDAKTLEPRLVSAADLGEAVIPGSEPVIAPTEFTAPPSFEPMGFPQASAADRASSLEAADDFGDLPPPPVPSGV